MHLSSSAKASSTSFSSILPEKTILVLEDIDALFVERKPGDSNKSMISFSGLLNTLDGIAHKEEQLTFLTTNYITKLDKTLIRPGRIDKTVKFSYATIYQIELYSTICTILYGI